MIFLQCDDNFYRWVSNILNLRQEHCMNEKWMLYFVLVANNAVLLCEITEIGKIQEMTHMSKNMCIKLWWKVYLQRTCNLQSTAMLFQQSNSTVLMFICFDWLHCRLLHFHFYSICIQSRLTNTSRGSFLVSVTFLQAKIEIPSYVWHYYSHQYFNNVSSHSNWLIFVAICH